jgi:hypothetical protein
MSEWISVKDRMPPGHELILIHCDRGSALAYLDSDNGGEFICLDSGDPLDTVTHWAPPEDAA